NTITVFSPAPGGGTSSPAAFTVNNPSPTVAALSPNTITAGEAPFTFTVSGGNFEPGAVVSVTGSNRTTRDRSSPHLPAARPAGDAAAPGSVLLTVFTGTPGGGTASPSTFTVYNATILIAALSPSSATVGGSTFTLTVRGTNFSPGDVVQFNGANR